MVDRLVVRLRLTQPTAQGQELMYVQILILQYGNLVGVDLSLQGRDVRFRRRGGVEASHGHAELAAILRTDLHVLTSCFTDAMNFTKSSMQTIMGSCSSGISMPNASSTFLSRSIVLIESIPSSSK